jgi:RHS repeat-associated protein
MLPQSRSLHSIRFLSVAAFAFLNSRASADTPGCKLVPAESVIYQQLKVTNQYNGFNEFINTSGNGDGTLFKKYRTLTWSGSVKESGTQSYIGTQRTDFSGTAQFVGTVLTNNLVRKEYRNLNDPASEGDGSGGPYIVEGDGGGGCHPHSLSNLLNVYPGSPGQMLGTVTSTTVVSPVRREFTGNMNLFWSQIQLPCNLFTFQTPSDKYWSSGPVVEELSDLATPQLVSTQQSNGLIIPNPVATLTFRMANNAAWAPFSQTPALVEDLSFSGRAIFKTQSACPGSTFRLLLTIESWTGSGAHTTDTVPIAVTAEPSQIGLSEIEVPFTLQAKELGQSVKFISAMLETTSSSCNQCNGGDGNSGTGPTSGQLGSIEWSMSMGTIPGGQSAGLIQLQSETWTPALYSPAALRFVPPGAPATGAAVITRADGSLRQIRTGSRLADIITPTDDPTLPTGTYEIRFYLQAGSSPSAANAQIYTPSGNPINRTRFSDPDGSGTHLKIIRFTASPSDVLSSYEYGFDAATNTWSLTEGGIRRTDKTITPLPNSEESVLTSVWDVLPAGQTLVSQVLEKYHTYQSNGNNFRVLVMQTLDPNGAALVSTWNYTIDAQGAVRLTSSNDYKGGWETSTVQLTTNNIGQFYRNYSTYGPFVNATPADNSNNKRRILEAEGPYADLDGDGVADRQFARVEFIGNIFSELLGMRYTKTLAFNGQLCSVVDLTQLLPPNFSSSDPAARKEKRYFYTNAPFTGKLAYALKADGTLETTTYTLDSVSGNTTVVQLTGAPNAGQTAVVDGTRTTSITNFDGTVISKRVEDIVSGVLLESETVVTFDDAGRPVGINYLDGSTETRTYSPCCGRLTSVSRHGRTVLYGYDLLGRKVSETADGITIQTTYDALDRVVKTVRVGSDGTAITLETEQYDLAGRVVKRTDPLSRATTFSESYNADLTMTRTTTFPDGGTAIETTNADGSPASSTGTAVAPSYWNYAATTAGNLPAIAATEFKGELNSSPAEWVKIYRDTSGRELLVEYPDGAATSKKYDGAGRLTSQVDADGVTTLYGYNSRGEQDTTALDVNGNGTIDFGGTDRIAQTINTVALRGATPVRRASNLVWEVDGQNLAVTDSISEVSADGLSSWQTTRGQTTSSVTSYSPTGDRTVSITAPDGVKTIQVFANNRLASVTVKTAADVQLGAVTYSYDAHGRQQSVTDARTGATTFAYFADDKIQAVTTPDPDPARSGAGYDPQVTTYHYDLAGRPDTVTQPDGTIVNTTYWPTGAVKRTWGSRTYPTEYTYDPQGRVKTLTTWQDFAGNVGAAVTTWNYHAQRGWLANKRYQDNTGPNYTYKPSGRLLTRVWARTPVITTTYGYNAAGDLQSIDYSDSTPDVSLTYDRIGRSKTMTDGSGVRILSYDASGQLKDEDYTAGELNALGVHRAFDTFSRLAAVSALSGASAFNQIGYAYDAASRLETVTAGANAATYSYLPNSSLVGGVNFQQGAATRLTTTKSYDNLNRLASVTNTPGAALSAPSFSYDYNSANQRTRTTREDNSRWNYTYDALGQVTSGKKSTSAALPVPGHDFEWTYDDIGNRRTATANGQVSSYTATPINTYAQRTVPAVINVLGAATVASTVTVSVDNGAPQATARQGELFFKQVTVANPSMSSIKITRVKNLVGAGGEDAISELTRAAFVPATPEVYTHDTDGNLTDDARWHYSWDGENRLIAMETSAGAISAGVVRQKLEFAYDSQGRRFSKKVYGWDGTAWVLGSSTRFLYDGWNLLADLNALNSNAIVCTYVWGLDLSGSLQGAGGVGGLLFSNIAALSSPLHAHCYDGNGNVIALIDMAAGAQSAAYEYNAFGETLIRDGVASQANAFRFSTKYSDENGLVYYGLRYYSPSTGRWLSRDPIEEGGGSNSYGFVGNAPLRLVDALGEYGQDVHGYFTYFAALAAGANVHDARTMGAYTWGPDASKKTNAIDVIYTDIGRTFDIQTGQHALTGKPPEPLRKDLLANVPSTADEFGRWSHVFEDSYAHVKVKHAFWTALLRKFGSKTEYERGDKLYSKGLGHALSGTIPDQVSTSPALFVEMARTYFGPVCSRYGGRMSPSEFESYAWAISRVQDSQREEFIKYIVRPCNNDSNANFDKALSGLPRLNLDPDSNNFRLPGGSSLSDWNAVKRWVTDNIK